MPKREALLGGAERWCLISLVRPPAAPCQMPCLRLCAALQDKDMVELLLNFKGRMDELLDRAMAKSEAFNNSLKVCVRVCVCA